MPNSEQGKGTHTPRSRRTCSSVPSEPSRTVINPNTEGTILHLLAYCAALTMAVRSRQNFRRADTSTTAARRDVENARCRMCARSSASDNPGRVPQTHRRPPETIAKKIIRLTGSDQERVEQHRQEQVAALEKSGSTRIRELGWTKCTSWKAGRKE